MRTTFPEENCELGESRTATAQNTAEDEAKMKFPMVIRNRKSKVEVVIYGKSKGGERKKDGSVTQPYPFYRLCWRVAGQRKMKSFPHYADAKKAADETLKELAQGNQVSALTPGQARDALAAVQRLQAYYESTGRRVSLLAGISEYCDATANLNGSLREAVEGYRSNMATVKRMDVAKAVEEFIAGEEPRTKASDGKRPDLNPKYHYNRAIMLRRFAGAFQNTAVVELAKQPLDAFFASLGKVKSKSRNKRPVGSAKSRNHHRAAVRQFLSWAVRKDYLPANHRLNEADGLRPENGNTAEVGFYTPKEFNDLLEKAEGPMLALLAIGGLAGLRTAELLRLDWRDVWRVENHIEVTSGKAKTRQRRLVEIVPALAQWLEDFRDFTEGRIWTQHEVTFQQHFCELCEASKVPRKTNGLRHSFCSFGYALNGEVWTAQQAGHDPRMLHSNYKGLATKKEAQSWFAVSPAKAENVVSLSEATGGKRTGQ